MSEKSHRMGFEPTPAPTRDLPGISSVASGGGGLQPPIGPKKKRKKRKNALSAHLCGLFAAVGVSNDFYSNIASVGDGGRGGELKFIDVTQNFEIFIQKNVTNLARLQTLKVTCTCA